MLKPCLLFLIISVQVKRLLITSNGIAKTFQPGSLGYYVIGEGFSNGKPIYKHEENEYCLHWNQNSYWTV